MKYFGQVLFSSSTIGSGVGRAFDYRFGDYYVRRAPNGYDMDISCWSRPYTMGQVLANEFGVEMHLSFKLEDGDGTEYVIFEDGIYENVKGKWTNVTQSVHTLPVFKRFLSRNDNRVVTMHIVRRDQKGFHVGDLIAGINDVFGITNRNMTLGRIMHIANNGDEVVIEVLEHTTRPEMVGSLQNATLTKHGKNMFKRVVKNED